MQIPRIAAALLLSLSSAPLAFPLDKDAEVGRKRDGTSLYGRDLVPGANLEGAVFHEGADLTEAPLAGANLTEAILEKVDLMNADLGGSILVRARLTGARVLAGALDPSRMTLLDTLGPDGRVLPAAVPGATAAAPQDSKAKAGVNRKPDAGFLFTPAVLTHFFQGGLPKGTTRELCLADDEPLQAKLVPFPGGLAWIASGSPLIRIVAPNGSATVDTGEPVEDLGATDHEMWFTAQGGRQFSMFKHPKFKSGGLGEEPFRVGSKRLAGEGRLAVGQVTCSGGFIHWVEGGKLIKKTGFPGAAKVTMRAAHDYSNKPPILALLPGPGDTLLAQREASVTVLGGKAGGKNDLSAHVDKALATERMKAILSRDGKLWHTSKVPGAIHRVDLQDGRVLTFSLGEKEGWSIFDLAEGPDGSIWFTQPKGGRLGWIDGKTLHCKAVSLDWPGSMPARLVNGGDGKMYFTLLGGRRMGAVAALDPSLAPPAPRPQSAAAMPAPRPQSAAAMPAPPAQSAAALPAPKLQVTVLPPAKSKGADATPAPAALQVKAKEAAKPGKSQRTAAATSPSPSASPLEALAAAGIHKVALAHVLERHASGPREGISYFSADHSSRPMVAQLIRRALLNSPFPRVLIIDGRWEALMDFKGTIGFSCRRPGAKVEPTNRLRVVLSPEQDAVISAYPVPN